jgi:hypothetical protein
MYTHLTTTPKNLKIQMIILTCAVYLINSVIMLLMHSHVNYLTLFKGVDFTTIFQVGLVFGLVCLAGYLYVPSVHLKQVFTLGYMLPLTGTSFMSINALYSIQKGMTGDAWTWLFLGVLIFLLAVSFGACYRILAYTLQPQEG